ncbi:MAG: hypothetical protein Q7T05_07100, partial [Dehalococcoidia bacterium]|nr:hypothetical protein [Dehalococcoidia bacterium]
MLALDCEVTGVDHWHSALPFLVTTCAEDGDQQFWEWPVNPLTRRPEIPPEDVAEIQAVVDGADTIVGQNFRFDAHALHSIGVEVNWSKVHDTIIAGHLLASNRPHNLTDMVMQYLGVDIEPAEKALEAAIKECRREVQKANLRANKGGDPSGLSAWIIGGRDVPGMPSAKGETWRFDYWLPRAMVNHLWESSDAWSLWNGPWDPSGKVHPGLSSGKILDTLASAKGWEYRPLDLAGGDHRWWTVLADYANSDSAATMALWRVMRAEVERRGLWSIYQARMRVVPVAWRMEQWGVTASCPRLEQLRGELEDTSGQAGRSCLNLASGMGHELELPKNGVNDSLRTFLFDVLNVPPRYSIKSKTNTPTLDKAAMEH